jgi:hypothetical protein
MQYVKIVLGLISLATMLAKLFERRGYLDQGAANAILEGMQKEARDVEIALKARRDARKYNELNPDRLRDDDGFKRPD